MKSFRIVLSSILFCSAALLIALFFCTLNIGSFIGSDDLSSAIGAVIAVLLTFIPVFCYLPAALVFVLLGILLLVLKNRGKAAIALLTISSIFLPIFLFSFVIDGMTVAVKSAPFAAVLILTALLYLASFGMAIANIVLLRRETKIPEDIPDEDASEEVPDEEGPEEGDGE